MAAVAHEFEDTRLRPGKLRNWKPKKWRVEYERVVAYSVMGYSNIMIAAETGYAKEHISVILNLDEAEHLRQVILKKMREKTIERTANVTEQLEEVSRLATKRLKQLLEDDDKFSTNPFAVVDRGLEILKGVGHLKAKTPPVSESTNGVTVNGPAVILNNNQANRLIEGMSKADQAIAINADVK